jgi:CubicO group peptidase (beta-lactamase class C family)
MLLLGAGLLVLTGPACPRSASQRSAAPAAAQPARSAVERRAVQLASELERWEAFGFSGAVLVAQGDRVLLAQGYGLADRARGARVTTRTRFDIGSISKQFTAAAVLKLVEAGRLSLHDSIALVLPDVPADKRSITPHHLLTHTSGISDFGKESEPVFRDRLVQEILAAPLGRPPGVEYEYSNLGYALLAAIVEIVSGERFETYLERELFEAAGLRDTGFTWTAPPDAANVARGYGGFVEPCTGEDPRARVDSWRGRGAGGVLSTVEDLAAWAGALLSDRVLGRASRQAMFTPHTVAEAEFLSYGYGFRIQSTAGAARLIWHSGLEGAYSSMLRLYVDDDVVMVFLSNLSIGGVPLREVLVRPTRAGPPADELFGPAASAAPGHAAGAGASLVDYGGSYGVGAAGRWQLDVREDAVVLRAEGQEAVDALFPPSNGDAAASYAAASDRALRIARSIADAQGGADRDLERIDPLGYAGRDAAKVAVDWEAHRERLGALREIEVLGTTALRSRGSDRLLTWLRLHHAHGALDEHVIFFAEDEIYLLPCAPATFEIRFRPDPSGGLVGFDLLSQRVFHARLAGADGIVLTAGDEQRRGRRLLQQLERVRPLVAQEAGDAPQRRPMSAVSQPN